MPAQHHETPTDEDMTEESSDDFYIELIKDVFLEESYKLAGSSEQHWDIESSVPQAKELHINQ